MGDDAAAENSPTFLALLVKTNGEESLLHRAPPTPYVAPKCASPSMCCCWQVRSTALLQLWRQAMCCSKGPLPPA
eukprot:2209368-Rhodomonas_salina.1